jgi:uncharacterized membrane protein
MMTRARRFNKNQSDSDVQMMETDIMRFLAIIALCLAVIFAIVSASASSKAQVQAQSNVTAEIASKAEREEVKKVESQEVKTQEAARVEELTPQVIEERIEEIALESVEVDVEEVTQLEPTLEEVAEIEDTPEVVEQAQEETQFEQLQTEEKKGFELRFESDSVFSQLVNAKLVRLYKITDGKYYQWQNGWKHTGINGQYYQLHRSTIPSQYVSNTNSQSQFGVALPEITQKALQRITAEFESGTLTINKFADIAREPLP